MHNAHTISINVITIQDYMHHCMSYKQLYIRAKIKCDAIIIIIVTIAIFIDFLECKYSAIIL